MIQSERPYPFLSFLWVFFCWMSSIGYKIYEKCFEIETIKIKICSYMGCVFCFKEIYYLLNLTLKLFMFISLICASRVQPIPCMKLSNMTRRKNYSFVVTSSDLLKTCKPNSSMSDMVLTSYPPDRRLCVCLVLCEYMYTSIYRTARIRKKCDSLFISYVQPHKEVSRDTIARWNSDL